MATKQSAMWTVMESVLPKNTIVEIGQIYEAIEDNLNLETDDMVPSSSHSNDLRWKRNVRNILQDRKKTSRVIWLRNGRYVFPSSSSPLDLNTSFPQKSRPKMAKDVFDRLQKRREEIGDEGEKLVMEDEKRVLNSIGRPDLAKRVQRTSLTDVGAGYDILSFNSDGSNKYIEVKTSLTTREIFEWSANEIKVATQFSDKYWLYLVRDLAGDAQIKKINDPAAKIGSHILIKPALYISELR